MHIAYLPIVQLNEPKQTLPADTARHLSAKMREIIGYLLRTSELSISQIADRLHFADTPSFSKFFSRLKGQSPRAFREQ